MDSGYPKHYNKMNLLSLLLFSLGRVKHRHVTLMKYLAWLLNRSYFTWLCFALQKLVHLYASSCLRCSLLKKIIKVNTDKNEIVRPKLVTAGTNAGCG